MIHLTEFIQRRGNSARGEGVRESREITADAASHADAKRSILEQLPAGWVVGSYRVS